MGWLADRRAAEQASTALAEWQLKGALLTEGKQVLADLRAGNDSRHRASDFMLHSGEQALISGDAALVEMRSIGGSYQGGSQGISVHMMKGVRYRVGASRGTYRPNPAAETVIDHGRWAVTTKRVIFMGSSATREWDFAKMIGRHVTDSGAAMLQVSNRQKASGIVAGPYTDFWIALGAAVATDGIDATSAMLDETVLEHTAERPGGWYSDPWHSARLRWYDGTQWTGQTHD